MAPDAQDAGPDPRVGTVLDGRYRIIERLAEGGMGVVYRGERLQLERPVAIKFLHAWIAANRQLLRRFENEMQAMSRLQHPHCTSVIDFGIDRSPYLVMDFVTGQTLRQAVDDGRLPPGRAINILRQMLAGLEHAHQKDIIHRDIKPENIMLAEAEGVGDHVRVLDFGLAKLRDVSASSTAGLTIGTPRYMSPEQARADNVDVRTDLYSAGIVLFELLVGRPPFDGPNMTAILHLQREVPPPHLDEVLPEASLSRELDDVVQKVLAKDPRDRYSSAAEFQAALEEVPESSGRPGDINSGRNAAPGLRRAAGGKREIAFDPTVDLPADALRGRGAERPTASEAPPRKPARGARADAPAAMRRSANMTVAEGPGPHPQPRRRLLSWLLVSLFAGGGLGWWAYITFLGSPASSRAVVPPPGQAADAGAVAADAGPALKVELPPAAPSEPAPPAAAPSRRGRGPRTAPAAPQPTPASDGGAGSSIDPPPVTPPAPGTPPEPPGTSQLLARVEQMLRRGQKTAAFKELMKLRSRHPKNGRIVYLLGHLYCDKNWWTEGIRAYQTAVKLVPAYRNDPVLIEKVVDALIGDRVHGQASRFLVNDIGPPAAPFLAKAVAQKTYPTLSRRAAATLAKLK